LTFDWNFLTSENVGDTFHRDFGFVSITPVGSGGTLQKLADTTSSLINAPPQTGFGHMTGFKTFTFTFTTAGTYVLGVGAMNAGDTGVNSGLLVDNFKFTPGGGSGAGQPGGGGRGAPAAFRGGSAGGGLPSGMGGPVPAPGGADPSGGGGSTGGEGTAPAGAPSVNRGSQAGGGSTAPAGTL